MGTRALTFLYEVSSSIKTAERIINMYRQYDGYPTGHGAELAEFLSGGTMTNGVRIGASERFFNGMGCLAAQLVANFKQDAGGFYLYPVTAENCGQDYEYHIFNIDGELIIKVFNCGCNFFGMTQDETYEPIFEGNLVEFTEFCKEKETA